MKTKNLLTTFIIASAVLMAGCNKDEMTSEKDELLPSANKLKSAASDLPGLSTSSFVVLAGTTITNDGETLITGDIGVSPGTALTGFQQEPFNTIMGPGTVTPGLGIVEGIIYAGGPVAAQAHSDAIIAYDYLTAQVPDTIFDGVSQLDGMTFTPGVYRFAPSANLQVNGTVYLDFQGNSDALFIFQLGTTLVTMGGSNVIALNNESADCDGANVYWTVGSSATLDGSQFIGSVIAHTTITMSYGSNVSGRIWAINGAVTMITDTVSLCGGTFQNDTTPNDSTPIDTTPVEICRDFVTGGGWIAIGSQHGKKHHKASFGVSGGIKNDKYWGQLSFNDHKGMKIKSTSVTAYIIIDEFTRQIEGLAKVNGKGSYAYTVVVSDNGEPGRNDTFSLELSTGYSVSGTLSAGGNIQLHYVCGDDGNNPDEDNYNDPNEDDGYKNCGDKDHRKDKNKKDRHHHSHGRN
jgi:hypothetical protein